MIRRSLLSVVLEHSEPALEDVALLIADDFRPLPRMRECIDELDALAEGFAPASLHLSAPAAQARALSTYLFEELGFRGNTSEYYDPRNSYLDDVLEQRTGIPITLSVVVAAVGRRVGIRVDGIGVPGHFLVRVGGPLGVYMDPFHDGRQLSLGEVAERLKKVPEAARPSLLEPVDARRAAVRLLTNLKHVHERRGDRSLALLASDRLVELTQAPEQIRDRGLHALALGSIETALQDLNDYLEARPEASDRTLVKAAMRKALTRRVVVLN